MGCPMSAFIEFSELRMQLEPIVENEEQTEEIKSVAVADDAVRNNNGAIASSI